MADEFEGGVCGGNLWNSSRNLFGSSPCLLATNEFGWPNQDLIIDMKTSRSSDESAGSASDGSSSIVLQEIQKPQQTLQMMGISLSSSTSPDAAWNQDLLHDNGKSEENYSNIIQEAAGMNFSEDSSINSFKQMNQNFPLDSLSRSTECVATCQGLSAGFPLNSSSYNYTSSFLQTLFDTDSHVPQQSLIDNQAMNYSSVSSAANNYQVNSNEFLRGLPEGPPMVNPSFAKQHPTNHFPFTNNAPLWNATAAAVSNVRASFLPSMRPPLLPSTINNKKPNLPSFRSKHPNEEASDLASAAKKASNEPAFKRPRIETPSPLPTFKVRKEKLGDRITALQQLVSPFGKTDTASVLHEAIEYIKFLHDQVSVFSTPYLKNGSHQLQRQQAADKLKDQEGRVQDLKSRGLCLVPISSTFPVAAETTADFWTPTFGGSFK